jgi:hypothetical protein
MVDSIEPYEFWVLGYGVQTLNDQTFFTSFQVGIRDKRTGAFAHADSDRGSIDGKPSSARVSLVEYHPSSFLEKGELSLECRSL